jgi:hypothetical protein
LSVGERSPIPSPPGSVVGCDLYNAAGLAPLADADIVALLADSLLPAAVRR